MRNLINLIESASGQILYHVTDAENTASILRTGFRISEAGELGPGVYLIDRSDALQDNKFKNGQVLKVRVEVPLLMVESGTNVGLEILRSLLGREKGNQGWDKASFSQRHDRKGLPNWHWLHGLVKDAGYAGMQLQDSGFLNTVVFDPKNAIVILD